MQTQILRDVIGCEAAKACSMLFPNIGGLQAVAFMRYTPPPSVQTRAKLSAEELEIANRAAESRKSNWFSYLEILLELSAKAHFVASGLLSAVNYHRCHSPQRIWLDKKESIQECLTTMERSDSAYDQIALCSKVHTATGKELHIPLLDFHIEKTPIAFELVKKITRILFGDEFIVLATNRSFHSLGLVLKEEPAFMRILANSILFAPIVDNAYVAHQLMEREATLRISKDLANAKAPKVVAASNTVRILSVSDINRDCSDIVESEVEPTF